MQKEVNRNVQNERNCVVLRGTELGTNHRNSVSIVLRRKQRLLLKNECNKDHASGVAVACSCHRQREKASEGLCGTRTDRQKGGRAR